jgi:hypothetical protein
MRLFNLKQADHVRIFGIRSWSVLLASTYWSKGKCTAAKVLSQTALYWQLMAEPREPLRLLIDTVHQVQMFGALCSRVIGDDDSLGRNKID